jgi:hypothetical protein
MRQWRRGLLAIALAALSAPAQAQDCPPVAVILTAIVSETVAQRADVTERLACHFPPGLTFNQTALKLEANGFDLLNKVERSFHRWRSIGGEEFVSRRLIMTSRGQVEFRATVEMQGRKLLRFSAQYLADAR